MNKLSRRKDAAMGARTLTKTWLVLSAMVAIASACGVDDRCPGADYEYEPKFGVCVPVPVAGVPATVSGDGGDTGNGTGDMTTEDADGTEEMTVDFGATCTEDADCGPGICLNAPIMVGCTQVACQEGQDNAGVCPSDFMCLADPMTGDSACIKF